MALKNLIGMTLSQLQQVAVENGMPLFTAKQIADWLYVKQVRSIDEMTNLSLKHRAKLAESYEVGLAEPSHKAASTDGTVKFLFPVQSGHYVEAVYIPDGDRATLCISSQVGCKMGCVFCMTGRQHYTASLTAGEILNQILSLPGKERDIGPGSFSDLGIKDKQLFYLMRNGDMKLVANRWTKRAPI